MGRSLQRTFFIWPALAVANAVNLLLFVAAWLILGGSALGVAPHAGGFFVSAFGVLSEVSFGAWVYSVWHSILSIVFLPLGLAGLVMTWVNSRWPVHRRTTMDFHTESSHRSI